MKYSALIFFIIVSLITVPLSAQNRAAELKLFGEVEMNQGNYAKAIKYFARAIDKGAGGCYELRANCYRRLNQYDLARQDYELLVDHPSPEEEWFIDYAKMEKDLGNDENWERIVNLGVEKTRSIPLRAERGKIAFYEGRFKDAIKDFEGTLGFGHNYRFSGSSLVHKRYSLNARARMLTGDFYFIPPEE